MIKLPKTFSKYGYTFNQVKRIGDVAIYSQEQDGKIAAYEVGRIKKVVGKVFKGQRIPDQEAWPSASEWGLMAWTYITLEQAMNRFNRMTGNVPKRSAKRKAA